MAIVHQTVPYQHNGVEYEGYLAYDDALDGPLPLVTISHAWGGRGDFENDIARKLATLGYAGFALDVYGAGIVGSSPEENTKLMTPLLEDRAELLARLRAGVAAGCAQEVADADKVASIGYCFGGLCALDLARSGDSLRGVVSFHGLFMPPPGGTGPISAKVLVLHGWDDPMAPPDAAVGLAKELTEAGADWQLHGYGRTVHAFTNPEANDHASGIVYNEVAAQRSWQALVNFLEEIF